MRIVGKCLATETSPKKSHVHADIFDGNPKLSANVFLDPVWTLYWAPYLASITLYICNTIYRFHATVRFIGCFVNGFYFFVGLHKSSVKIAARPFGQSRFFKVFFHSAVQLIRSEVFKTFIIPYYFK